MVTSQTQHYQLRSEALVRHDSVNHIVDFCPLAILDNDDGRTFQSYLKDVAKNAVRETEEKPARWNRVTTTHRAMYAHAL